MTKQKIQNELSVETLVEKAVREYYKCCNAVQDVKVTCTSGNVKAKVIFDDSMDYNLLLDISAWETKNKYENYARYYIVRVYRTSIERISIKNDIYSFEKIKGDNGYLLLEYNMYETKKNPYTLKKLEYEYVFREYDVESI